MYTLLEMHPLFLNIQTLKEFCYYYYLSSVTAPAGEGLYESEDMQSATFTPVHHEAAVEGEGEDLEEEEQDKEEELEQMHTSSAHSMNKVRHLRACEARLKSKRQIFLKQLCKQA